MAGSIRAKAVFAGVLIVLLSISAVAATAGSGARTVLLVRSSSDFKDSLAEELRGMLIEAGYSVAEEISLGVLGNDDFSRFAGIVVVDRGMAGRPGRKVRSFMEREAELPPVVVVTTYGNPSKVRFAYPERAGLDGLTSASLENGDAIRDLAGEVISRLGLD